MTDKSAVEALIQNYFDALYNGDVAQFREIFHTACRLFTIVDGKVMTIDHEPYMARVAGRPSGASRKDARKDEIVSIEIASPTTAHARVRDVYMPNHFVNELTFLKEGERWWIVAKVWHVES